MRLHVPFTRHDTTNDWNRLINLLIDSTLNVVRKISGGNVQNNEELVTYVSISDSLSDLGISNNANTSNPIPALSDGANLSSDGGISILFISSEEIENVGNRYNARHFIINDI